MTRLIRPAVLLAALALTGCGGGTTDVSGKVTYKGKPVVYGTVVVLDGGGVPKSGAIQPDGTFRVSGVKVGRGQGGGVQPAAARVRAGPKPRTGRDADDDKPPADVAAGRRRR